MRTDGYPEKGKVRQRLRNQQRWQSERRPSLRVDCQEERKGGKDWSEHPRLDYGAGFNEQTISYQIRIFMYIFDTRKWEQNIL